MRVFLSVAIIGVLCSCAPTASPEGTPVGPPRASARPTASEAPSADLAVTDLDRYLELLEVIHPEPFHGVSREAFVERLMEVQAGIGERAPEETMVAVMQLVAMLSREDGRDGHQLAIPIDGGPMLPIRVFEFADGVFVTGAVDPALVGARIVEVAGQPIDELLERLEPLVPRDSPATVPGLRPFFLLRADVLQGIGVIDTDASVEVTLETAGGTMAVSLETIPFSEFEAWGGPFGLIHLPQRAGLRFTDFTREFWTEWLDPTTLYVRLAQVRSVPRSDLDGLRAELQADGLARVVFDLRHNPGGDNTTYPSLLRTLQDIDVPLWILTDRRTFSAAGNLATELEQSTDARFAGEAMGGGLNFWNDVNFVPLENLPIPMRIGISTRYWQKSTVDDPRLTIEPDLAVEYRSADYFAGRDTTLEAVLTAP